MVTSTNQHGKLSSLQERQWFNVWVASLVLFFIATGAGSLTFLWRTRHAESTRHRQLLDPEAPDPGVTVADDSSAEQAVPVEVGFYVERVPELSTRDANWTAVFDI